MYSPTIGRALTDSVLTAVELNAELGVILSQINGGLDRENVDANVLNAWDISNGGQLGEVWDESNLVSQPTTMTDGTVPGLYGAIPDDVGNPMNNIITVPRDGQLHVLFGGSVQGSLANEKPDVLIAVAIDGLLVAKYRTSNRLRTDPYHLEASVPVTGGDHIISYLWAASTRQTVGASLTVNWLTRYGLIHWLGI